MSPRTAPARPIRSRAWAAGAVIALLFGLAACGDDDDDDVNAGSGDATTVTTAASGSDDPYGPGTTAGDTGGDTGGETAADTVEAIDFELTSITVAPGAEVTFENKGEAPHTMTADEGAFDSGRVEPGASTTVAAPAEPGDYPFHCEIHPAMTGTLTVEG